MNSFGIVFFGVGGGFQLFGQYGTFAEAIGAIATQQQAQNYLVGQCYGPATIPQTSSLSPQPMTAGAWVAILTTSGQFGNSPMIMYGTFASFAAAQAWILAQPFPSNYVAAVNNNLS